MTFQFKIQIKGITKPPVWRRISMPSHFSFDDFHVAIQAAFGWSSSHLYQFSRSGYGTPPFILVPHEDNWGDPEDHLDSFETKLSDVFNVEKQKFTYIYDFGDNWVHSILLEKITDTHSLFPLVLAGKGACPLDDIGGVWGYEDFKEGSIGGSVEEYKELLEWYGLEDWDPKHFDLIEAQEEMMETFMNNN